MVRLLSRVTGTVALAATLALPALALAQADTRPVVVVFRFDNNSIGAGRADFDGMATGIQDLLITDLASNSKVRLVDRAHLNDVLNEQNLARTGQVDPATAVRLGRILGAQYAVTGGFLSDGKGSAILTGRTIDIETTQISNPQKITGKTDDVLGLITRLSGDISSHMNLAPKPGVRRSDAGTSPARTAPAQNSQPATTPAAKPAGHATTELYSRPLTKPASLKVRLDVPTMKLYSNALDELDRKHPDKARQLFQKVLEKSPGFEPAQRNIDALGAGN